MDKNVSIAIITSIVALLVSLISGVFSSVSTKRTTTVERQKAYLEFLQHKMNKLEEVQQNFMEPVSEDDPLSFLSEIAREKNNKTDLFLTSYAYLFTHNKTKFDELVEQCEYNSLCYGIHLANQHNITVNSVKIKDLPDPSEVVQNILKTADAFQALITDELIATYQDFENLSK